MKINHITKLQIRQTGQAGLRFKQLLYSQPTGLVGLELHRKNNEKI